MNRKTLFSFAFYKDSLARIRAFTLIVAFISAAFSAYSGYRYLTNYLAEMADGELTNLAILTLSDVTGLGNLLVTLVAPIMTVVVFSYLYTRMESDYYEMLPVSRRAAVVSGMAAVFTSVVFTLLLSFGVFMLVTLPCYGKTVVINSSGIEIEILNRLVGTVIAITFTTIAASLAGSSGEATYYASVFLTAPRFIMRMFVSLVSGLNPMLISSEIIPLFNAEYNVYFAMIAGYLSKEPLPLLYSSLVALVGVIVAVRLYVRRKSEYASHSFAVKMARHGANLSVSAVIVVFSVMMWDFDHDYAFLFWMLLGLALAFYFISELIASRKQKGLGYAMRLMPLIPMFAIILIGSVLGSNAVLDGFTPAEDDIDEIYLVSDVDLQYYDEISISELVTLEAEDIVISDPESRVIISEALSRRIDSRDRYDYVRVPVKVRTGILTSYRYVYLTEYEYSVLRERMAMNEDYRKLWLTVLDNSSYPRISSSAYTLSGSAAESVVDSMAAEIRELGFDAWYSMAESSGSDFKSGYTVECSVPFDGEMVTLYFTVPSELVKTVQKIENEIKSLAETKLTELNAYVEAVLSGDSDSTWLTIYYFADGYYGYRDFAISTDEQSRDLCDRLLGYITTDKIVYSEGYICIAVESNSLFGGYLYFYFDVDDAAIDEIIELIESQD